MLTGFTFCIPIRNKSAEEVVTAWRNHILFPFGVCRKLLTDNGMEFKNELFNTVAEQLGVERKITHHHTGLNQMVALRVSIIS